MTTRVICTPRIVSANMSLPFSLSRPNGWSPSWMPAPPSHVGRSDIVGAWSGFGGTTSVWSHFHQPGIGPSPMLVIASSTMNDEHDQRDHRALVAEEPPAHDLALAEAGDLALLEALLVDVDRRLAGRVLRVVGVAGSSVIGAVIAQSAIRMRGSSTA